MTQILEVWLPVGSTNVPTINEYIILNYINCNTSNIYLNKVNKKYSDIQVVLRYHKSFLFCFIQENRSKPTLLSKDNLYKNRLKGFCLLHIKVSNNSLTAFLFGCESS